jgi:hypothetical protein
MVVLLGAEYLRCKKFDFFLYLQLTNVYICISQLFTRPNLEKNKNLCRNYRAFLLRNVKLLSSFFNFLFPLFPKDLFPKKVVFPACFQGGNSGNRNWEQVETVDFTLFLVSTGNRWKQVGNRRWEQVETILSTKLALRKYRHRFFPVIKEI